MVSTPSFAYDQQLGSMPTVVREVLGAADVPRLEAGKPIIFSGIGTSLHAARVAAEWVARLSRGRVRPYAIDAHDLGTTAPICPGDQVVVISHRGYKKFPTASLDRAKRLGAEKTIAIVGKSAPEQPGADHVIRTCENDTAGTFSVSYLASLAVLAKMAAQFEADLDKPFSRALDVGSAEQALGEAIERSLSVKIPPELVDLFSRAQPLLIIGFGLDLPTAQEAALKIKEGAWIWTEAMSPEFALHGTPASFRPDMSAIVIAPREDDGGRSALLRDSVLKGLDFRLVATCADAPEADLPFFPPPHPWLRPFTAILPFHTLTAELARHRGTDPDTLHGHRHPWKEIMTGLRL